MQKLIWLVGVKDQLFKFCNNINHLSIFLTKLLHVGIGTMIAKVGLGVGFNGINMM